MDKFTISLFGFICVVLIAATFNLLLALPVMWIWNDALVPAVTFAKPIGWGQTWALLVLVSLRFKITNVLKNLKKD